METRKIKSIPGALARSDGRIKLPNSSAKMPHGGIRDYKTKWRMGSKRKAFKTARHQYLGTTYRGKSYKVHRLICEAFHGPPPKDKPIVIHLNEDALDNRPENIRWGTQKENLNMPKFIAYCKTRTGKNNPFVKGRKNKIKYCESCGIYPADYPSPICVGCGAYAEHIV